MEADELLPPAPTFPCRCSRLFSPPASPPRSRCPLPALLRPCRISPPCHPTVLHCYHCPSSSCHVPPACPPLAPSAPHTPQPRYYTIVLLRNFYPAPCSLQAAELTRAYCVSVVHAKDMIPRLAVATMEQLVQVGAGCRGGAGGYGHVHVHHHSESLQVVATMGSWCRWVAAQRQSGSRKQSAGAVGGRRALHHHWFSAACRHPFPHPTTAPAICDTRTFAPPHASAPPAGLVPTACSVPDPHTAEAVKGERLSLCFFPALLLFAVLRTQLLPLHASYRATTTLRRAAAL